MELPEAVAARYEALRPLGEGAVGVVTLARQRATGRLVAVKQLRGGLPEGHSARARREAEALLRVRHPNVLELLEVLDDGALPILVTEYVEAGSLEGSPPEDPVAAMLQVAEGLEALHRAGLVHRDLKPANLLRGPSGRVVLGDLGLAFSPDRTRLTETGCVVGSPAFMAPESLRGEDATPASDWYAWGASLFWLVEGRPPFELPDLLASAARGEGLPPLREDALETQPRARALVEATLRLDPESRATDLETLRRLAERAPEPSRPAAPSTPGQLRRASMARPRGAPPGSRLSRWRRAALGLSCLVGLGAGLLWIRSEPAGAPAEVRPGPTRGPRKARPLPWDRATLARVPRELEGLYEWVVTEDLRVLPAPEGTLPPGTRALMSPDPLLWALQLSELPTVRDLRQALRELPAAARAPEVLRDLEDLDARFAREGLPRPFAPYLLDVAAREPRGSLPSGRALLERVLGRGIPELPEVGGTGRAALGLLLATLAATGEDLDARELPRLRERSEGVLEGGWGAVFMDRSLGDMLLQLGMRSRGRRILQDHFDAEILRLERALFLSGRALDAARDEPAEALAVVAAVTAGRASHLLYSHLLSSPPEALLPGGAPTPSRALVLGTLTRSLRRRRRGRGHWQCGDLALDLGLATLAAELEQPLGVGWTRIRRQHARDLLLREVLDLGDHEVLRDLVHHPDFFARGAPGETPHDVKRVRLILDTVARERSTLGLPLEVLRDLRAALRARAADLSDQDRAGLPRLEAMLEGVLGR